MTEAMISCLCISKGDQDRLQRAIRFYCAQSWARKELVLVVDDTREVRAWLPEYLVSLGRDDWSLELIPPLRRPAILNLGTARNISIDRARGDILCQWDDDDYYHPDRLRVQAEDFISSGDDVSFLGDQLQYFADTHSLYWTNWHYPGIPGTLMAWKSLGLRYVESVSQEEHARTLVEDSLLQREVAQKRKVRVLRNKGMIYTYVYHGSNSWDRPHHEWCALNLTFSRDHLRSHRDEILRHLTAYFPGAVPHELCHPLGGPLSLTGETTPAGAACSGSSRATPDEQG